MIGASSADIRCSETVTLESTLELPCLLDAESTMREWMDDPRGRELFEPVLQRIVAQIARGMAGEDANAEPRVTGSEMIATQMDMPPISVVHWQARLWSETPEAIIASLLDQLSE